MDTAEVLHTIRGLLATYRATLRSDRRVLFDHFTLTDVAHKVVGVGSIGLRAWVLLFESGLGAETLVLQAKQAEASVLAAYAGASEYASHAERVVAGQHLMQASSDIFLGWLAASPADGWTDDYYLRQLRDWKASVDLEHMSPRSFDVYARMCGWTLARPRPVRRPDRPRRVPWPLRRLRPGGRHLRRGVRRPQRARPRSAGRGRRHRPGRGRDRRVNGGRDMTDFRDMARRTIESNRYMVLGTADEAGVPWVTPVWFAQSDYRRFVWVSSPDRRHSRNVRAPRGEHRDLRLPGRSGQCRGGVHVGSRRGALRPRPRTLRRPLTPPARPRAWPAGGRWTTCSLRRPIGSTGRRCRSIGSSTRTAAPTTGRRSRCRPVRASKSGRPLTAVVPVATSAGASWAPRRPGR